MTAQDSITDDLDVRNTLIEVLGHTTIDLATSKEGINWSSSAFYTTLDDDPFRLTLILETSGRTLEQLQANPNVGVKVVPQSFLEPFVQGLGTATVREPAEREQIFQTLVAKEPRVEPFLAAPVEPVVIDIDWWRVTHIQQGWLPGKVVQPEAQS